MKRKSLPDTQKLSFPGLLPDNGDLMTVPLKEALRELLLDWRADISREWLEVLDGVEPAFDDVDEQLEIHPWEPIFPSRRHFMLPGEPHNAHIFRAFDEFAPDDVRCVVIGQDPYPCISFSTGRAFEVGGYRRWSELGKMKSDSMRSLIQFVYAFRSGKHECARGINGWPEVLQAIREPGNGFPPPGQLAQGWVEQGVLLLNSSLTISRFSVHGDPHQVRGHLPLWKPFMARLVNYFFERLAQPVVFLFFGKVAQQVAVASGVVAEDEIDGHPAIVSLPHPAAGNDFLRLPNPFILCNEKLLAAGAKPVEW